MPHSFFEATNTSNANASTIADAPSFLDDSIIFDTICPTLDTLHKILPQIPKECKKLPIYKELYADFITPIMAIALLKSRSQNSFLLESMQDRKQWGRYSFLGFEPSAHISYSNGVVRLESNEQKLLDLARFGKKVSKHHAQSNTIEFQANPKEILREVLKLYKSPNLAQYGIENIPSFSGGLVGYFAYEYIGLIEEKLDFAKTQKSMINFTSHAKERNPTQTKDIEFMLFDSLIIFDNLAQKLLLLTNIDLDKNKNPTDSLKNAYIQGIKKLESIEEILCQNLSSSSTKEKISKEQSLSQNPQTSQQTTQSNQTAQDKIPTPPPCTIASSLPNAFAKSLQGFRLDSPLKSHYDKAEFCAIVDKAKHYIKEGDIFQVVLSNPLHAKASGSLFDVYRVLRTSNPSPYMFYLTSSDLEIAGASPETLLKLQNGTIYTYPLAGSRPRGSTPIQDENLAKELLSDEKELSEHNMLVDLGRNDIGRVAKVGSVKVEQYQNIVRYSHIMHISSRVSGILRDDKDAFNALDSIFPAGTLSGAPKIRACEIIHELEGINRGIYGGAIGYLDFSGNMDMCIGIRLVVKQGDEVSVRSGAGIVYDSDGEKEFIETQNKAKAVINALQIASQNAPKRHKTKDEQIKNLSQ
ncbi:anthranilate synthase component I family protein [Helicobacter sp. MIT 01-3238]|uniref:anthranilate synthase component I family protein n=1 Tax=Helicobacter sp. MIT 01-3238 TaxID=398627 RepID=UPI000E1EE8BF|nr:chorismate-binding protein [Helicobacter sp. MIT 01-3238]RDU55651.1 anthranilate synthase component I [Helicobacter sp. MIT 01-3238]